MAAPPQLTPEQRAAALEKAGIARRARAELKEKLKLGMVSFPELLDQAASDEIIGKMKVLAVLESLPGVGQVNAPRNKEENGISENPRVPGQGVQQRVALLAAFPAKG
jgi:hypothetical protein